MKNYRRFSLFPGMCLSESAFAVFQNTIGYENLLGLVKTTTGDSLDLYCGLFYYNANSKHQLDKLEQVYSNTMFLCLNDGFT